MFEYEFNSPRLRPWEVAETCVECGSPDVQHHHIFHGIGRRAKADKYGYVIPLCINHHTGDDGIHQWKNRDRDLAWKRKAQEHYETYYGSREDFIREFGKSYL